MTEQIRHSGWGGGAGPELLCSIVASSSMERCRNVSDPNMLGEIDAVTAPAGSVAPPSPSKSPYTVTDQHNHARPCVDFLASPQWSILSLSRMASGILDDPRSAINRVTHGRDTHTVGTSPLLDGKRGRVANCARFRLMPCTFRDGERSPGVALDNQAHDGATCNSQSYFCLGPNQGIVRDTWDPLRHLDLFLPPVPLSPLAKAFPHSMIFNR
ncbi:hypothetical protein VTK26DRAFT_7698 [Humicola hyalothermophila]